MPQASSLTSLHRLVWTAMLAALTAVGSYLYFPLGPAPISLQTFFVLMAGFILGPWGGVVCMGLYLSAGLIGLPIFSGGKSGLGHLLGPTGGFLVGFMAMALLAGLANRDPLKPLTWARGLIWGALATLTLYLFGVTWLKVFLGSSWGKAAAVGMLPFLPGDVLKLAAAVASYKYLQSKRLAPS